ncbi:hypothetical protein AZ009_002601, partial [Klebsiella pneumoniae]
IYSINTEIFGYALFPKIQTNEGDLYRLILIIITIIYV